MIRSLGESTLGAHALLDREGEPDLARRLGGQAVEPQCREQADHARGDEPCSLGEAMVLADLGIRPGVESPRDPVGLPESVEPVEIVRWDAIAGQVARP